MEITAYGLRYRVRAHEKEFFPEDAPRPVQPGCPPLRPARLTARQSPAAFLAPGGTSPPLKRRRIMPAG